MSFETKALLVVCGIITLLSGGAALYAKFFLHDANEELNSEDLQDTNDDQSLKKQTKHK